MTAETFQQIFEQMSIPVLLHTKKDWLENRAAMRLNLSEPDLQQLAECGDSAFLWIALGFFRVTTQTMDDDRLFILQPDTFLSEAAQNVSSQIRQRLQYAFGCLSDLSCTAGIRDDLRARERLSGINRELYQLLRMTQELEMSRPSVPAIGKREYYDLVSALIQTGDELKELFSQTDLEFKMELEPPELLLLADQEKINYLVLSLISNSMAHLPKTGGQITLGLKQQNGQAIITVSDNGSGFTPDLLSRPLWTEPERLVFGRGLGLGLPLVQRIAAAHGGTVMAFPSDKGARVTVSIPIEEPEEILFSSPITFTRNPSGFSVTKILLSNALPRSLFYPASDDEE